MKIFVYGTLMPDYGNYRSFLLGRTESERHATIKGKLLNIGAFPALIKGNKNVHGVLIRVKPEFREEVIKNLDALEGHPYMYKRKLRFVQVGGKRKLAWVYVWQSGKNYPEIKTGNWADVAKKTLEHAVQVIKKGGL